MTRLSISTGLILLGIVLTPGAGAGADLRLGVRADAPRTHALASPVAEAGRCHATGWRTLRLPGARRSIAMDMATDHRRVTWVVGMRAGRSIPRRPWAVARTDSGWRSTPVPYVGADAGLTAIDATSRRDAWAVGFRVSGRDLRPVAVRWTGGRWIGTSPPWGSGGAAALTDVSSGHSIWAVGYRSGRSGPQPYAVRWRSGHWVRHDPSQGRGRMGALVSVVSTARQGIWAAGWSSRGTGASPLLIRLEAGRWVRERLPGSPGQETVLTGLTSDGQRPWAVGYRAAGPSLRPVVFRRLDAGWVEVDLPDISASMLPDALVVGPERRLALVGTVRQAEGTGLGHALAEPADGSLGLVRRPAGIGGISHLRDVAADGRRLMAVGWTDGRAAAIRQCRPSRSPGLASPGLAMARQEIVPDETAPVPPAATTEMRTRRGFIKAAAVNAAGVRFRDVARRVGLGMTTHTYGGARLDFDGDGWDDLLISRHQERGRLLMNRLGSFRAASGDPLPGKDRHGCAGADIDGDGRDEAYCSVGAARGVKLKSNELFDDLGARHLRNSAGPAGVGDPLGRGRMATFLDADGDGDLDLLVLNDSLRVDGLPSPNRLFLNDDGSSFRPAPGLGLDLSVGGTCAFSAQLDGHGPPEVGVCTIDPWKGRRGLHLFRRGTQRYVDETRALGVTPQADVDALAADFDGDSRLDLAQLSSTRLVLSLQRGGRLRRATSLAVRDGRAIAAGDVNADRRADLFVMQGGSGNADDLLLVNRGTGRAFRRAAIPQARAGSADDVIVIDHDRNGLDDFLVLNGLERAGPVQLIAAFRR